ncbi:sensory histidine kinase in two-component regulatory system with PhoB [Rubrivivax sp. A210]|uniref:phosphate regulon sensor histidine kinase PhoR n=1 Tax=Rubrivivax sp. A210 TaxID=2772301 RepID=UPI00191A5C24|nr:phosphate regulon sensor histidine kinase PhoR [Rubrivivax sp. A210]CAD5373954.1 sensory histidine kinase in two-component regulatory system with PhoB [Rubrivivax sp. A210]
MGWVIARFLAAALTVATGVFLGFLIGGLAHAALVGMALGGLLGVFGAVFVDSRQGRHLLEWLRGAQGQTAPRDTGYWGELAYRIERAMRLRDSAVRAERERLQQFLSAIDASPNGVMMLDHEGAIEWCNAVAAVHFGLDPVRDRRQRITNLVRAPAFVAYMQAGQFDEAVVFPGPQGGSTLSVLARPYGDGMRLVLTQDITERERNDAMRRDFVANVSHEIRTPLTVLSGFLETMASLPLSEAERQRVLALMQQQTQRMQALVGDLLTLAQLEGSPRPGADRWLPVAPLLRRAQADATALSGGRHQIERSGGDDAELAGSDTELLSAIGNLLNNAVRYTPEGGRIALHWLWREDGSAEVDVSDSGPGIAREHIPRLTERFYRVDGSRSRDTGGTGLGLSIVKHVIQRHGGEIDITSEPGQGSTFRLVFPTFRARRRQVVAEAGLERV